MNTAEWGRYWPYIWWIRAKEAVAEHASERERERESQHTKYRTRTNQMHVR